MVDVLPFLARKGRGATLNPDGRFERYATQDVDDGWERAVEDTDNPSPKTNLHIDTSRSVINAIDSPDLPYMRSINPYRGCENGCIYCYARPSHGYLGFSAGMDFETEIFHKPNAPELLRRELAAKHYQPHPITLGSNTDCYQPVERGQKLTRRILQVLSDHHHAVTIITKSALVMRDIDLLVPMAAQGLAQVLVSVTTLDPELARAMEPRAAAPYRRLETIKALADAGIPVTVMAAPMIPALNDMEMEKILEAAWEAGARSAHYTLVRLPHELKDLMRDWLHHHRPDRAEHVLSLIRDTRGGKLYDAAFGTRRSGTGPYATLIADRFRLAVKRIGFNRDERTLRTDLFRKPEPNGQMGFDFGGA